MKQGLRLVGTIFGCLGKGDEESLRLFFLASIADALPAEGLPVGGCQPD